MASERVTSFDVAHSSILVVSSSGKRTADTGTGFSTGGRPRFFRITFFVDLLIIIVLRLFCLKRKRPATVLKHQDGPNPDHEERS
jgi:hypothetical protein